MKNYLLFDLDGTLTDSGEGIMNSVAYALKQFGIYDADREVLRKCIGPPLKDSFMKYYGFSEEKAEEGVEKYREYFADKGMFENAVYDGIPEMLGRLKAAGKKMYVATSKPSYFALKILEHFGLNDYFIDMQGSNMDGTRSKKDEVIAYVLEKNQITDLSDVVMIGDRKYDILGSRICGISNVGVLFGYGSRAELEESQADYIAEDVNELEAFLLGE